MTINMRYNSSWLIGITPLAANKCRCALLTGLKMAQAVAFRAARAPTPGIWLLVAGWLSGLRLRECVCTAIRVAG